MNTINYSAIKNEIISTEAKWMGQESSMLSKINQIQEEKYCMFFPICESLKMQSEHSLVITMGWRMSGE